MLGGHLARQAAWAAAAGFPFLPRPRPSRPVKETDFYMAVSPQAFYRESRLVESGYVAASELARMAKQNDRLGACEAFKRSSRLLVHCAQFPNNGDAAVPSLEAELNKASAANGLPPARIGAVEHSNWHQLLFQLVSALDERLQAILQANGLNWFLAFIDVAGKHLTHPDNWPAVREALLELDFDLSEVRAHVLMERKLVLESLKDAAWTEYESAIKTARNSNHAPWVITREGWPKGKPLPAMYIYDDDPAWIPVRDAQWAHLEAERAYIEHCVPFHVSPCWVGPKPFVWKRLYNGRIQFEGCVDDRKWLAAWVRQELDNNAGYIRVAKVALPAIGPPAIAPRTLYRDAILLMDDLGIKGYPSEPPEGTDAFTVDKALRDLLSWLESVAGSNETPGMTPADLLEWCERMLVTLRTRMDANPHLSAASIDGECHSIGRDAYDLACRSDAPVGVTSTMTAPGLSRKDALTCGQAIVNVKTLKEWCQSAIAPAGAADAIVAPTTKRRGRKQADYETVQREAEIATNWEQARDCGVSKADFARENGLTVKELDKLIERVAKRKKRSGK